MSFIRLTSMIINTKYTPSILLNPSIYYGGGGGGGWRIYIANRNINGFMLFGTERNEFIKNSFRL